MKLAVTPSRHGELGFVAVALCLADTLRCLYHNIVKTCAVKRVFHQFALECHLVFIAYMSVNTTAAAFGCTTDALTDTVRRGRKYFNKSCNVIAFIYLYNAGSDYVAAYRAAHKNHRTVVTSDTAAKIIQIRYLKSYLLILLKLRHRTLPHPQGVCNRYGRRVPRRSQRQ